MIEVQLIDSDSGAYVVKPHGHVRGTRSESARHELDDFIRQHQPQHLIVDFGEVTSVDSAWLGYLLSLRDRMTEAGGGLALARLAKEVRLLVDSIGLTRFFRICETLPDAIAATQQGDLTWSSEEARE